MLTTRILQVNRIQGWHRSGKFMENDFPIGNRGQLWYLIVLVPDLCTLTYFALLWKNHGIFKYHNGNLKICVCAP